MILTTRFACAFALAFLLPLYKFPPLSFGLSLRREFRYMSFFLETLKRNNGRFRNEGYAIGRGARCRDATRTRSSYRSTGCVSPVKEKREKGKVANRFFPFIVTFARTHIPAAKNFSHSTCTTRLSCKRKNSLASTFPTDLWQTLFVHFFLSLFFFRTPDSRNIGFSPSDYSREFRQIYLDPRFGI